MSKRTIDLIPNSPQEIVRLCVQGQPVLLEWNLFYYRLHEYDSPLTYNRWWEYEALDGALVGLADWIVSEANEPAGWVRAGAIGQPTRKTDKINDEKGEP